MKTIKITRWEIIEVNDCITSKPVTADEGHFCKFTEKKWLKFCKDHNFHPIRDCQGKIYELYLQFCAERIV